MPLRQRSGGALFRSDRSVPMPDKNFTKAKSILMFRSLGSDFDPKVVGTIHKTLASIEQENRVRIPLAIESGSRAWGFPSPDSDYDCRFIFVRPDREHVTLWPRRDVIEVPLTDVLDINGWDLAKALKLMLKGNAVVFEWLQSPYSYIEHEEFQQDLLQFGLHRVDRMKIYKHYYRLGKAQRETYFSDERSVPMKKLFYAVRPAAALRWMRANPDRPVPPMHFQKLVKEIEISSELRELIDLLLAEKAKTREMGAAPLPAPIAAFISEEFDLAASILENHIDRYDERLMKETDDFYRQMVSRWG